MNGTTFMHIVVHFGSKLERHWKMTLIILNEQINLASIIIKILHCKLKITLQIENWLKKLGQLHSNLARK